MCDRPSKTKATQQRNSRMSLKASRKHSVRDARTLVFWTLEPPDTTRFSLHIALNPKSGQNKQMQLHLPEWSRLHRVLYHPPCALK